MSRWHREHPEHYEVYGEPDWLGAADMERKRQKEEGTPPCPECGRYLQLWSSGKCPDCTQGVREPPLRQLSPDRAVITDDDRELCRACGELPATRGMYCRRCDDSIRDEREMRDA